MSLPRLLVLLMVVCLPAGADAGADQAALRQIKEVLWPQAYREQDVALLDRLLAAEFQMVDAGGNWYSKADELAWVSKHGTTYESFRFAIKRLDLFENGTAVVAGEGVMTGTDQDGAYRTTYQSSNILIKRDGRWQAIASHVSGIKRQPRASMADG